MTGPDILVLWQVRFRDSEAAARAYDAAALQHFGEFAALNFREEARHAY